MKIRFLAAPVWKLAAKFNQLTYKYTLNGEEDDSRTN